MIKPYHLNYSAPPPQIKTSGHHLPPSLNDRHELEEGINYTIMPALRPQIGALKNVVVLPLPHLTPQLLQMARGICLANPEATTVAEVLAKKLACRFGVPLYNHSDQGCNCKSAIFGEVCNLLGMTKDPNHTSSSAIR